MAGLTESYAAPIATTFARLELEQTSARQPVVRSDIAPTPLGNVAFELVRTYAAFDALEGEWNELFERCGKAHQIFQSFNWNWQWAQAFLDVTAQDTSPSTIAILTGRINGRLVSLWPMIITHKGGLTELSWMGEPVSQYGDVLLDATVGDPLALLRAGWAHICLNLKPDLARFRKVRGDAAFTPLLDTLSSLHTAELEAPFIDLTRAADFTAYEERFPNRARRNRRRQMRRLEEAGAVTFKHLNEGAEASALAATAIDLKRQWLIDRGYVSPALADVRMHRFMTEVASSNSHSTATRVSVLQSAEKPAAIQIGFTSNNTRVLHVIVYDKTFEKMAAGVLHLEEAIRHGFEEKLERIDLLAPAADYKMDWADGTVAVVDHAIGLSPKGKVYARVYLGFLRGHLKTVVERLPHKLRQRLVATHLRTVAKRVLSLCGIA